MVEAATELEHIQLAEPLAPDSIGYIERVSNTAPMSIEAYCRNAILQTGALIRIKGSKHYGKTSLMMRILHDADRHNAHTVYLSMQAIDPSVLQNLDSFWQWFCKQVTEALHLPNCIADYWDDLFGSTISCRSYFEEYLLPAAKQPIVLALDDVDRLFTYPDLADEFFGLLRVWHEDSKTRDLWKKLRLLVAHATEVYIPLNIHKSPFNVGIPIDLQPFTREQIQTLAERYEIPDSSDWAEALTRLVGGHPYLVQLGLLAAQSQPRSPDYLLSMTVTEGIYAEHLEHQWRSLDTGSQQTLAQLINVDAPMQVERMQALKLQSLGLVKLHGETVTPSCELYDRYFRMRLAGIRDQDQGEEWI